MDALKEDIEEGNLIGVVTQLKDSILDCAKCIKSNDDTFKISTLPQVSDKLREQMSVYQNVLQDVQSTQMTFTQLLENVESDSRDGNDGESINLASFEDLFNRSVGDNWGINWGINTDQTQASRALDQILGQVNRDEDIVLEAPSQQQWPKDPITKMNIRKAVRSKQCKHTYDKKSIEGYIAQKERARSTLIACPVAGCVNRALTRDDLEPDDEANNLIEFIIMRRK